MIALNDLSNKKVEITYPCNWEYRLVCSDANKISDYVKALVANNSYTLKESNKSSTGKFISIIFEVIVGSEEQRLYYYEELRKCKEIKYIL